MQECHAGLHTSKPKAHTGLWFCDCCINEIPADRFGLAGQVEEQLGAVAVAVSVGLDMAGPAYRDLATLCRAVRTSWLLWRGGMSALSGHGAGQGFCRL
ncbi:hypothetical protein D3C85_1508440 [compost metagenome]